MNGAALIKSWFLQYKRSFPWRENPAPYTVWVSEVMLQQTRASVVIPYFLHWMQKFPTVEALANASKEEVLKAWEGLGYYSRARNLHEGAKTLAGKPFPSTEKELRKIKGIGAYTTGAILSFAYKKKAAAIDGNVARVISRYFGIKTRLDTADGKKTLEEKTLSFLPDEESFVVMEALIELGALICTKTPVCTACPMRSSCFAYKENKTLVIPSIKPRGKTKYLHKMVAIIVCEEEVLITINEEGKVLGGLAQFPTFSYEQHKELAEFFPMELTWLKDLPSQKQTYTIFQEELSPSLFSTNNKQEIEGFFWCKQKDLATYTFTSGHKRIYASLFC